MKAQGKNYIYIISAPPSALGNGVKAWKCGSIWNYANEGLPNPHLSQLGSLEVRSVEICKLPQREIVTQL